MISSIEYYAYFDEFFKEIIIIDGKTELPTVYQNAYIVIDENKIDISSYINNEEETLDGGKYTSISLEDLINNNTIIGDKTYEFMLVKDGVEYKCKAEIKMYLPYGDSGIVALLDRKKSNYADNAWLGGLRRINTTIESAYVVLNGERINISNYLSELLISSWDHETEYNQIGTAQLINDGILNEGETYEFILVKNGIEYIVEAVASLAYSQNA